MHSAVSGYAGAFQALLVSRAVATLTRVFAATVGVRATIAAASHRASTLSLFSVASSVDMSALLPLCLASAACTRGP